MQQNDRLADGYRRAAGSAACHHPRTRNMSATARLLGLVRGKARAEETEGERRYEQEDSRQIEGDRSTQQERR